MQLWGLGLINPNTTKKVETHGLNLDSQPLNWPLLHPLKPEPRTFHTPPNPQLRTFHPTNRFTYG